MRRSRECFLADIAEEMHWQDRVLVGKQRLTTASQVFSTAMAPEPLLKRWPTWLFTTSFPSSET